MVKKALETSKVVIITNARKGWVEFSSNFFMPRLHEVIMKYVKIISARVNYEDQHPYDTYRWKELAFMSLWEEKGFLDEYALTNLIAVGDSMLEMEAARNFAESSDKCLAKLIKFRENPTFQELKKELSVLNA